MQVERVSQLTRRGLLQASLAGSLAGCAAAPGRSSEGPPLVPIEARVDRIRNVSVCVRPFRPAGPRVEVESLGDTLVVHNYGHGGSGWSLSWGSSARAVQMAMAASPGEIAVIGCGALGLTSAILAQRAGCRVTIYAREQIPFTTSARATGEWTPYSRVAQAGVAGPAFATTWEEMARAAFKRHRDYLGLSGTPVEWVDNYSVEDVAKDRAQGPAVPSPWVSRPVGFVSYGQLIRDITPRWRKVPIESTPFAGASASRSEVMVFNISDYSHTLLNDFFIAGGQYRRADFQAPSQIAALGQKVVINCTGLGARALWKDETMVPIRGQIARLIPQPDVRYALNYRHVMTVPRRDGMVVQSFAAGEMEGYGETSEAPDRAESEEAVRTLAEAFRTNA